MAERALKTIVSSARCMFIASGLPFKFWAEATRMATIVHNCSPVKPNNNHSPSELWENKVPDVSKLRTFGCRVLVKDPEPTGKFTIRTWDGIYVGPAKGGDGHRIYDPATKRFNNSRDVFFLEDKSRTEFYNSPILDKSQAPQQEDHSPDQSEGKEGEKEEKETKKVTISFPKFPKAKDKPKPPTVVKQEVDSP